MCSCSYGWCERTFLLRHRVGVGEGAAAVVPVLESVVQDELRPAEVDGGLGAVEGPRQVLAGVGRLEGGATVHRLVRVTHRHVGPRRLRQTKRRDSCKRSQSFCCKSKMKCILEHFRLQSGDEVHFCFDLPTTYLRVQKYMK